MESDFYPSILKLRYFFNRCILLNCDIRCNYILHKFDLFENNHNKVSNILFSCNYRWLFSFNCSVVVLLSFHSVFWISFFLLRIFFRDWVFKWLIIMSFATVHHFNDPLLLLFYLHALGFLIQMNYQILAHLTWQVSFKN